MTAKYDLRSYDTDPVVVAFTVLEYEIKERFMVPKVYFVGVCYSSLSAPDHGSSLFVLFTCL